MEKLERQLEGGISASGQGDIETTKAEEYNDNGAYGEFSNRVGGSLPKEELDNALNELDKEEPVSRVESKISSETEQEKTRKSQEKYFDEFHKKRKKQESADKTSINEIRQDLEKQPSVVENTESKIESKRRELREAVMKTGNMEEKVRLNNELNALLKEEADRVANSEKLKMVEKIRTEIQGATNIGEFYNIIQDADKILKEDRNTNSDAIRMLVEDARSADNPKSLQSVTRFLGIREKAITLIIEENKTKLSQVIKDLPSMQSKLEALVKNKNSNNEEKVETNESVNNLKSSVKTIQAKLDALNQLLGLSKEPASYPSNNKESGKKGPDAKKSGGGTGGDYSSGAKGGGFSKITNNSSKTKKKGFFEQIADWFK